MDRVKFVLVISLLSSMVYSTSGFSEGINLLRMNLNMLSNTVNEGKKIAANTANEGKKLAGSTANEGIKLVNKGIDYVLGSNDIRNQNTGGDNKTGNERAETKQQWIHKRCPRSGSLYLKTGSGKLLRPGELNALSNAMSVEELFGDFYVKFILAKPDFKYTMVKYANGLLVQAIYNIKGEDLQEGVTASRVGKVLPGMGRDAIIKFLSNMDIRFCVELLEQNPAMNINDLPFQRAKWDNPLKMWHEQLTGTAGKTCFTVLLPNAKNIPSQYPGGELGFTLTTFEKQLEEFKKFIQTAKETITQTPALQNSPVADVFFLSE